MILINSAKKSINHLTSLAGSATFYLFIYLNCEATIDDLGTVLLY